MGASPRSLLSYIGGESTFSNPIEIYGFFIVIIALIMAVLLTRAVLKIYRERKNVATLYFLAGFIMGLVAGLFLFIELYFHDIGEITLGDIAGLFGLTLFGIVLVLNAIFAFYNTFPDRVKLFGAIVIVVIGIFVGITGWAITQSPPIKDVINGEMIYAPWILIVIYSTIIPVGLVPPISFHYYGFKVRKDNPGNSNRSYWFAVGFYIFGLGYINELAPFFPPSYAGLIRTTYVVAAIILYFCFTMPEWFKKRLGITT